MTSADDGRGRPRPPRGERGAIGGTRWWRYTALLHPVPVLLTLGAALAFAWIAARGAPDWGRLALLAVSVAASQVAIAVYNDYCDRDLDAVAKPWRPIPAGAVSPRAALALTGAALVVWVAATVPLGAAALLWAVVGTAGGLAYDVGLKRTGWSWVPFVVAFPSLPLLAWAAMGRTEAGLVWVYPVGGPLVLGLHLADTLPDLAQDARLGVRGLAHRLGPTRALGLCWACFAGAPAAMGASSLALPLRTAILAPAAATGLALSALAIALYFRRGGASLRTGSYLLAVAAIVYSAGWLAALVLAEA